MRKSQFKINKCYKYYLVTKIILITQNNILTSTNCMYSSFMEIYWNKNILAVFGFVRPEENVENRSLDWSHWVELKRFQSYYFKKK